MTSEIYLVQWSNRMQINSDTCRLFRSLPGRSYGLLLQLMIEMCGRSSEWATSPDLHNPPISPLALNKNMLKANVQYIHCLRRHV